MKKMIYLFGCLATGLFMASCDTDVESVDINEPGIEGQNSALYESYLSNLRAYKQTSHKAVFGWFDNSAKTAVSQGQNIVAVPDSLDFLVISTPENLTAREYTEISTIREKKGIETLVEINFNSLSAEFDLLKQAFEENPDNAGKQYDKSLNGYLVEQARQQLAYVEQYGLKGVVMTFYAKEKMYMTDQEKAAQTALENNFLGMARDWKERHSDKMLVLAGKPQYVEDTEVLDMASYIVIPCEDADSEGGLTYNITKAAVDGVPTDKFVPLVTLYSLDATDTKTGYWGNSYAALGAAKYCAAVHDGYTMAGLALKNIGNDYYHANFVYPVVREAINIVNPTVQK